MVDGPANGHVDVTVLRQPTKLTDAELRWAESELRAMSVLVDRLNWARQAGVSFDGARDLYAVLGYPRVLTATHFYSEYMRGGIAGRIVDALPSATWRGEMELVEDEDPTPAANGKKLTTFEQAWKDLDAKHQIQAKLLRVDKLAGLSTFAVLLLGAPGNLETELPRATKTSGLLYLTPFLGGAGASSSNARSLDEALMSVGATVDVDEMDVDPTSPRFGLPTFYKLRRTDLSVEQFDRRVHHTRVVHIAENLLDNETSGLPTLERVFNLLIDLQKITGGGAEAFWLRANQGMQLDVDKDAKLDPDELTKLASQAEEYKHQITRMLRTKGVDVKTLGSDVANFSNQADAVLTQIAGSKGIPKRILTGSEMGELASSQDRDNWNDQVNGRQKFHAGPYIVRPLVDRLIAYGYLPTPKKSYAVRWPHVQALTAAERSAGAKSWADTNRAQGETVFTPDEIRDKWEALPPLDASQRKPISQTALPVAAEARDELTRVLQDAIASGNETVVDRILERARRA